MKWLVLNVALMSLALAGCGASTNTNSGNTTTTSYTVGGSISGLNGTVTLQLNTGLFLSRNINGGFTFSNTLPNNASYTVAVSSHPAGQSCAVSNGSGVINNQNVSNILVNCNNCAAPTGGNITISGTVRYERIPFNSNTNGLNYSAPTLLPVRGAVVQAINASNGSVISSTTSSVTGTYSLTVPDNTNVYIRALAQMTRTGTPSWDFRVVDNTSAGALYSLAGQPACSGTTSHTRNLIAGSGWGGSSYTATRAAAPFAILDNVYTAVSLITTDGNANAIFPPLNLNWSINNRPVGDGSNPASGDIGTSFYNGTAIYILGAANSDTDEFDSHVVVHEFGHYVEDKFSRSDSIGGQHGQGNRLDMRVAFGEGFGNAFAAIVLNDPIYRDSGGTNQAQGFSINIENNSITNPGWFSEGSVESILYDLYDASADGVDAVNLGFAPIYNVLANEQRTTSALTSIFTFITALKTNNAGQATDINNLLNAQIIATNADIYGANETNSGGITTNALPIYTSIATGGTVTNLCTIATNGTYNKLGNRRFLRLNIATAASHTVSITGDTSSDPDIYIHRIGQIVAGAINQGTTDSVAFSFSTGEYIIEVLDYNLNTGARTSQSCFTVSVSS